MPALFSIVNASMATERVNVLNEITEAIQNLPTELREIIYKEYMDIERLSLVIYAYFQALHKEYLTLSIDF